MKKKLILLSIVLFLLLLVVFGLYERRAKQGPCAFCNSAILTKQNYASGKLAICLYSHKPVLPGHCLIIPKRHVERYEELSDDELMEIHQLIRKTHTAASKTFGTSSYLLLQKNGKEVGQTVPHVHFHYIPRRLHEKSDIGLLIRFFISPIFPPISEKKMHKTTKKLAIAMETL